jgi:hypothetical protein
VKVIVEADPRIISSASQHREISILRQSATYSLTGDIADSSGFPSDVFSASIEPMLTDTSALDV